MDVYHEMPIFALKKGWEYSHTDGSYALVHLFETHTDYYQHFVQALRDRRPVILDNSLFELGEAFEPTRFVYWLTRLALEAGTSDTLLYVIPDVFNNTEATVASARSFLNAYPNLPGKAMAVAQGNTAEELAKCYTAFAEDYRITRIGIPYHSHAFEAYEWPEDFPLLQKLKYGRIRFIAELRERLSKEIHLLGASLPDEFQYYSSNPLIASVDTSNPVVHGLLGIRYEEPRGLLTKENIKLADMIDIKHEDLSLDQIEAIFYNLASFRRINHLEKIS